MSRRDHFDAGHGNERFTLDNIMSEREQSRIKGQMLGESLWNAMEEAMGGPGSFKAAANLASTNMAHQHFSGENLHFSEDDGPRFRHNVNNDIFVNYRIPGEPAEGAGEHEYFYADMYKRDPRGGNRGAPLDVLNIPGPMRHNPEYIKAAAKEWHDETYLPNKENYDFGARYDEID